MRRLPAGPPPRIDVLIGSTLLHEGKAIPLDLRGTPGSVGLLGSVDATAYLTIDYDQVYRVVDDGSLVAVGTPHKIYNDVPRMSTVTGRVYFPYNDRGTAKTTVTVMDARTGDVLDVLRPREDVSKLPRDDRLIVESQRGVYLQGKVFAEASPGRRTALHTQRHSGQRFVPRTSPQLARPSDIVEVWSLGQRPRITKRLSFPILTAGAALPKRIHQSSVYATVFENSDSFLVLAAEPRKQGVRPRSFLIRCSLDGTCEQAESTNRGISLPLGVPRPVAVIK